MIPIHLERKMASSVSVVPAVDRVNVQIDILSDTVNDMMDKLFYIATDGKTIDYAWDAPQPAALNPLNYDEIIEFGESAMSINYSRIAHEPQRLGQRVVSRIPGFAQRSAAAPFHGYRSDPPKAPSFGVVAPIGPVAKAFKAAGELAALAERNGESSNNVWQLLEGTFGVGVKSMAHLLKPDISASSQKDEIKFIRPLSHMLYGFNSTAPAVAPNTGRYRAETMAEQVMFDWDAFSLTLRYLGEMNYRYNPTKPEVGSKSYFAPAERECRLFNRAIYSENIVLPIKLSKIECLQEAITNTIKYLLTTEASREAMLAIRSESRILHIDVDTDIPIEAVRNMAKKHRGTAIMVPKNVSKYRPDKEVAELKEAKGKRFLQTIVESATKTHMQTIPSWFRVVRMVLAALFQRGFVGSAKLLAAMRKKSNVPDLSEDQTKNLAKQIAHALPKSFGYTVYCILDRLSPDKVHSVSEFMEMISVISGNEICPISTSYDEAVVNAITSTKDVTKIIGIIQAAWNCNSAHVHGISRILRPLGGNDDLALTYRDSVTRFLEDRMSYWAEFYKSVVVDCRNRIRALKDEAKERRIPKQVGRKLSLEDTIRLGTAGLKNMSDEEVLNDIAASKTKMVKSNFSSEAYKRATVTVSGDFRVRVFLQSGTLKSVILHQADNYARKRSGWGRNLAAACDLWAVERTNFLRLNRVTDILDKVDKVFEPDVTWRALYNDVVEKFAITESTVTNMFRRNLAAVPVAAIEETAEEEKLVRESDRVFLINNSYAILYDSDSDDDYELAEPKDKPNAVQMVVASSSIPSKDSGVAIGTDGTSRHIKTDTTVETESALGLDTILSIPESMPTSENAMVPSKIVEASTAAKAIRAKVEKGAVPGRNASAMFSKLSLTKISAKIDAFDELGYSLRDHLKSNHMQQYHFMAYEKFLESIGEVEDDYKSSLSDVKERAEEYLRFNNTKAAQEARALSESTEETTFDIA